MELCEYVYNVADVCMRLNLVTHTHTHTHTQSYAGKYVPAIGYKIHIENQNNPIVKINFKGVAIGDGLVDPVNVRDRDGERERGRERERESKRGSTYSSILLAYTLIQHAYNISIHSL